LQKCRIRVISGHGLKRKRDEIHARASARLILPFIQAFALLIGDLSTADIETVTAIAPNPPRTHFRPFITALPVKLSVFPAGYIAYSATKGRSARTRARLIASETVR
jgi:hypothetical protein